MDIAVLIKQVPVSNDVSVDPETHALIRSSSEGMINPADLNAIEAAMVLKEQTGGKVSFHRKHFHGDNYLHSLLPSPRSIETSFSAALQAAYR